MSNPQIIISLLPDGNLAAELPGINGMRRKVYIRPGRLEPDIIHALKSQLSGSTKIGEDGAPDVHQVRHWDNHGIICTDKNCKRKTPHSHTSNSSDPSCPFCISEGRFERGRNRERAIRNLSENEALRLGLISRGFVQSKTNPDIWNKKNMASVRLLPNGKLFDSKNIQWSKSNHEILIGEGKLHALKINFTPIEAAVRKYGDGSVRVRTITKLATPRNVSSKIKSSDLVEGF